MLGVNLLGENIRNVKKNAESLRIVGKEAGLGADAERTICVCPASSTECRKNEYIEIGNKFFEKWQSSNIRHLANKSTSNLCRN